MNTVYTLLATLLLAAMPAFAAAAEVAPPLTPAERKIAEARRTIDKLPARADGWNALAMALARRARETANPAHYLEAEAALAKSAALEPNNYEASKVRVWVLLGKHEFGRALVEARALNQRMPDDVIVYGLMADAHVELGQYEEAEKAVQWMLDMRPGNVPALTRAAYLREIFGDLEGASEFMQAAYQRTPSYETEDRAWIATHLAHLERMRGAHAQAAELAEHALTLHPRYHYALAELAKVRISEKHWDAAIRLLRDFYAAAPHPENLYLLADTLVKAGRTPEARKRLADFEAQARTEMHNWDNANRELTFFYVDHARNPARALEVARAEAARRQDVLTLDALAWALSASGKHAEAKAVAARALAHGSRDAGMLYRAGVVAMRAGDRRAAEAYFERSLQANPRSAYAALARANHAGGK